jgi:hypothetical protein
MSGKAKERVSTPGTERSTSVKKGRVAPANNARKQAPGTSTKKKGSAERGVKSLARKPGTGKPGAARVKRDAGSPAKEAGAVRAKRRATSLAKKPSTSRNGRDPGKRSAKVTVTSTRLMRIRELDPQAACGPGTTVMQLFRVDHMPFEDGTTHLVFHDRHGWYCAHGRECPAVAAVRKRYRHVTLMR